MNQRVRKILLQQATPIRADGKVSDCRTPGESERFLISWGPLSAARGGHGCDASGILIGMPGGPTMHSATEVSPISMKELWIGRTPSSVPTLFLLLDSLGKLLRPEPVVASMVQLGYRESVLLPLGIVLLACTVLYVIPRTSVLGAILLTGYLGGVVATHVRAGSPLLSQGLFPIYLGALIWGGLFLREVRLRALLPLRS